MKFPELCCCRIMFIIAILLLLLLVWCCCCGCFFFIRMYMLCSVYLYEWIFFDLQHLSIYSTCLLGSSGAFYLSLLGRILCSFCFFLCSTRCCFGIHRKTALYPLCRFFSQHSITVVVLLLSMYSTLIRAL